MRHLGLLLLASMACAPAVRGQDTTATGGDLPPVGFGTLNQDDITIDLRQDDLEVRLMPLDERILRLLAPDAYNSLHELVRSRKADIDSVGRRNGVSAPGIMLATFFGRRQGVRFDPQNVYVTIRNQFRRPIGLVPFSPNFTNQQLDVRERAIAILIFDTELPVFETFSLSYGIQSTNSWESQLGRLQRERERVAAKARQAAGTTPQN